MKHCARCNTDKPKSDFYRHPETKDGLQEKCKECAKAAARSSRDENLGRILAYDRKRGEQAKRKSAVKSYAQTEAGKAASKKGSMAWQMRNPEKRAAHVAVSNAVRDGKLQRKSCEACGNEETHAHHDNYDQPLDVRWLCVSCHSLHHKQEREVLRTQKC